MAGHWRQGHLWQHTAHSLRLFVVHPDSKGSPHVCIHSRHSTTRVHSNTYACLPGPGGIEWNRVWDGLGLTFFNIFLPARSIQYHLP